MTLTRQLTVVYGLAMAFMLAATFLVVYLFVSKMLDVRMDEDLVEDIEEFRLVLKDRGEAGVRTLMDEETFYGEDSSVFLQLLKSDGSVHYSTDMTHWPGVATDKSLISELTETDKSIQESTFRFQTLSVPGQEAATRTIYGRLSDQFVLIIGESTEDQVDILSLLASIFFIVFLISLPLAALLTWFLTRHTTVGIHAVKNAAINFSEGQFDSRVESAGGASEVQTLADTFNAMASRIQVLIRNMREVTDNIAHDLRSPVGRIRLIAENLTDDSPAGTVTEVPASRIIRECDALIDMINTSLDVAEAEAGIIRRPPQPLNISELVVDACDLFEPLSEEKLIRIYQAIEPDLTISGDINSIQRMVANLLDNAIKFTPRHGQIHVSVKRASESVLITVRDSGVGISDQDSEHVFDRFFRGDPSRSCNGCGLGLSYARAVARAHDGDISVESVENDYTVFTITLPLNRSVTSRSLATPEIEAII